MILLIEGVDCTGKTTLVNKLKEDVCSNFQLHKSTNHSTPEEIKEKTSTQLFNLKGNWIFDRHTFISALIYGVVINGYTWDQVNFKWFVTTVQKELNKLKTFFIYCTASTEAIKRRLISSDQGSYIIKPEDVDLLKDNYELFIEEHLFLPTITLNSEELTLDQMHIQTVKFILKHLT